jgi:hypothetical protein
MVRWQFRNYVQPSGKNRVREWYLSLSTKERTKLDRLITILERQLQWTMPHYKTLGGKHAGLSEIRWNGNQNKQLRLLGCRGPLLGQYTLLLGCSHKGDRYTPTNALNTAALDLRNLEQGIGDTCEHESKADSEIEEE